MTDNYLQYGEAYPSPRKTVPDKPITDRKVVIQEMYQTTSSLSKNVVYTERKTSYRESKYVHKQDNNTIQTNKH